MGAGNAIDDLLGDRLHIMANSRSVIDLLPYLDRHIGGLIITGTEAPARCREIRNAQPDVVVAMDPESHTQAVATPGAPFGLRTSYGWWRLDMAGLTEVLDGQLLNKASYAVTPTCFIPHGEGDADQVLASVFALTNELDRTDTVVLLPVSYKWLQPPSLPRLAGLIRSSRHPVALVVQADGDPMDRRGVMDGLRQLCRSCPRLLLWRTDLAAFDAMVHGALGAAVGVAASLRHGVKPRLEGGGGGWKPYTSVLVGRLLRYVRVENLQDWFAHSEPWACGCSVCQGQPLTRFDDTDLDRLAAVQHDVNELYALHGELAGTVPGHDRHEWWRARLTDAVEHHRRLAVQTDTEPGVPDVLLAWRRTSPLPLPQPRPQ
ncbi:hypothetical protein [Streptomyces sp. 5-6(2022)]|uniref:hypothetical protein n=1 Tax=Streptomyces sp. 5-6(2022) TaxID=2936510 RepID=UPI0023B9C732|nr:hypothetical protein [Streptomyces sp. 5-6(2022)]